MKYIVFDTQQDVDLANARWIKARAEAGIKDVSALSDLQITSKWCEGRQMLDGRFACPVPLMFKDDFGGAEIEVEEYDFPVNNIEL